MRIMQIINNIRSLPDLSTDKIHIWGVEVPRMAHRMADLEAQLSTSELDKAGRFRRELDRHASIVARGTLRVLLGGYTDLTPTDVQITYAESGKPHLAGSNVEFNVSHSGDWIVIAVGRNRAIGVDIEKIRRDIDLLPLVERYFLPEEQVHIKAATDPHVSFYQHWVRKEAYIKACGSTLLRELKRISVPLEDGAEKNGWFFHYLEAGSTYAAAVVTDKPLEGMPCYDFGALQWEN